MTTENIARIGRAIRRIRQRIFDMPEAKQDLATLAIGKLKARLPAQPQGRLRADGSAYHWMIAAE